MTEERRGTHLHRAQKRLVKGEKHGVELVDIVTISIDEIHHDDVELVRRGERQARP